MLLLGLVVGGTFLFPRYAQAGEVFLEPAAAPGLDPFSPTPFAPVPDPATTTPVLPAEAPMPLPSSTPAPVQSSSGGTPGLYGGSMDKGACDAGQMVAFLAQNPDKANAWVDALNADSDVRLPDGRSLTTATIPAYVATLTPLVLVADTRATNHGYRNGRPTQRQSVLQRGTAVLVDAWGVPRVKCYCGNPLLPPVPSSRPPTYRGRSWEGFDPSGVSVVVPNPTPVEQFTVVPLDGGTPFALTPGTPGIAEGPPLPTGPAEPGTAGGAPLPSTAMASNCPPRDVGSRHVVLSHDSGSFDVAAPGGWSSRSGTSTIAGGAPLIDYAPDLASFDNDPDGVGFSIVDLTHSALPPGGYADVSGFGIETPGCSARRSSFPDAGFTVTEERLGPCAETTEWAARTSQLIYIDAQHSDGTRVGVKIQIPPGQYEEVYPTARNILIPSLRSCQ